MMPRWLPALLGCLLVLPAKAGLAVDNELVGPDQRAPLVWQIVRPFQGAVPGNEVASTGAITALEPGQSARFLVESGRYLRLRPWGETSSLTALEVLQSRTGGWFQPLSLTRLAVDGSRASTAPLPADREILLTNTGTEPLQFQVAEGRRVPTPEAFRWHPRAIEGLPEVTVGQHPQQALQRGHWLHHTEPHEFRVQGPGLFAVELRDVRNDLADARRHRLAVGLDDEPLERHYLHFADDNDHVYHLKRRSLLLSQFERLYLWVPEGDHRVTLKADHDLLLALLQAQPDRVSSSASERPWRETEAILRDRLLFQQSQRQRATEAVLEQGAGAAHLAAASFDSDAAPGWPGGFLNNRFSLSYTQDRLLWPDQGAPQKRLVAQTAELNLTPDDELRFVPPGPIDLEPETFFQVAHRPLILALPETPGPTQLRLTLAYPEQSASLRLSAGDRQWLLRFSDATLAHGGQLRLTGQSQTQQGLPTAAPKVMTGDLTLDLPEGTSTVRIEALEGATWARATVREGRHPALTEAEYWDFLRASDMAGLARSWRAPVPGQADGQAPVPALLWRDSQFLRDWLNSRYHSFIDDLSPAFKVPSDAEALANLDGLVASGEDTLAVSYAQGLYVYSSSARVRDRAYRFLTQTWRREDNQYGLESLLATAFLHHDDDRVLPELALMLERQGLDTEALKLALVLHRSGRYTGQQAQVRAQALRLAIQADWPLTLHELTRELPAPERSGWRELYLAEHYNVASEPQDESVVPPVLAFWARLPEREHLTASAWLRQFHERYPGRWRWQDWPGGFAGELDRVNLHNPDLDRFYQRHRVAPDRPLALTVTGPVRLRLNARLLHQQRDSRLNDWLRVRHNGRAYRFPVLNSGVFNRHRIIGSDTEFPGRLAQVELELGPGQHQLSVAPEQHRALVQAEIETPAMFAASYLSAQNRDCFAAGARPEPISARQQPIPVPLIAPPWAEGTESRGWVGGCAEFARARGHDAARVQGAPDWGGVVFTPAPTPAAASGAPAPDRAQDAVVVARYLDQVLKTDGFARNPGLVARSNALAAQHPDDTGIQQRLALINADHYWEREELVIDSAGIRQFDASGWPPALPYLRQRQQLLSQQPAPSELALSGPEPVVVDINQGERRRYRLDLRLDKVGFQRVTPVAVDVRVDGQRYARQTLSEAAPSGRVQMQLPAGASQIELQLVAPTSRHWVYAQLSARAAANGPWQPVERPERRAYQTSLPGQPLVIYLDQPSWLRLEVYDGQKRVQRYRYVASAGNLVLRQRDLGGPYVRVYALRHQPGKLTAPPPVSTPVLSPWPEPVQKADVARPEALMSDALAMPTRDDGTQGAYAELAQRRNFDGGADAQTERYLELGWRYQQQPLFSRWTWQSDLFLREHSGDESLVLGSQQWLTLRPDNRHWRLNLFAGGYWQPREGAGSLFGQAQLHANTPLAYHWSLDSELTGFGRWLSVSSNPRRQAYDDDVFTEYKADHRHGLEWQEALNYQPWQDSRWRAGVGVRTNEDFSPDRIGVSLRWDEFWHRDTRTYVGLEQRWLMADDDRAGRGTQQLLSAGVDWRLWEHQGRRWSLGFDLSMDLDQSQPALALSLGFDNPGAKRLEDFRAERFPFFPLQEINAARAVDTNELNYVE
ncbi:hypothetical protein [Marinobacter sp.]|uniref:hypothetical protein n=1 Tax=Marinobacter sp. TaxID=50741 RepID=UPI0035C6EF18